MKARPLRACFVAVALTLGSFASPCRAAPPSTQDTAFKTGLDQYARGNYVGAIATWESLLTTLGDERRYKVLYNLGSAYEAVGDVSHALERYRAFIAYVERTKAPPDLVRRADDAEKRARQIEESYGAVHVGVPKRGGAVLTRVGAAEPRVAGYVIYLAPGLHVVEVHVGTEHAKKISLDVQKGRRIDVDTSLPDDASADVRGPPVAAQPAAGPRNPSRESTDGTAGPAARNATWLIVGGVATAASIALPASLYVVARGKRDSAAELGDSHPDYPRARSEFTTWRTAYLVSWSLPTIVAAGTIGAYVLGSSSGKASARAVVGPGSIGVAGQF